MFLLIFVFLCPFFLKKENECINNQTIGGQSESKGSEQAQGPTELDITGISTKASSRKPKKPSHSDHLQDTWSQRKKLSVPGAPEDICPSVRDDCRLAVPSSVKRTFSEIERSPEPLESLAKKRTMDYKRFFDIPEEIAGSHTGLTGTFSTFQIGEEAEHRSPKRSSPVAVAKSLFSELDEPMEDVFEGGAEDMSHLSFTSPLPGNGDVCRNLSLDSDGSTYETSIPLDGPESVLQPNKLIESSLLSEEKEKNKNSSNTDWVAVVTPTLGPFGRKAESHCSLLSPLPGPVRIVARSSSFLRPRNGVVFRSYCSSINRSNISGVSRLSVGSLEPMDASTSASYHSAFGGATPVQRKPNSCSSVYQVGTQG